MPALPAAADIAKVEVLQTIGTVNVVNILHFRKSSAIAPGDVATLAAAIRNGWATSMLPNQTVNLTLDGVRVTDLTSITGEQATAGPSAPGTNAGDSLPSSAAMVVTTRSATRSRSGRGRTFIAALPQSFLQTAQTWTTASMADVLSDFGAVIAAGEAAGGVGTWTQGVLSYYSGVDPVTKKSILRPTPIFFPRTLHVVDSRIDSQRRRLGKG